MGGLLKEQSAPVWLFKEERWGFINNGYEHLSDRYIFFGDIVDIHRLDEGLDFIPLHVNSSWVQYVVAV